VSTEDSKKNPTKGLKPFSCRIVCVHKRIYKSPRHGWKPFYTIFCVHRRILKIPRIGFKPFFVESSVSTEYITLECKIEVIVSCYVYDYDKRFAVGDQNDIFTEHGYTCPPHSRK
jgi:hypothetical protein